MKKSLIYILFCFFCLVSFIIQAQNNDSLKHLLTSTKEDSTKITVLLKLIELSETDEEWQSYNKNVMELSEKLFKSTNTELSKKGKKGIAEAYYNIGYFYSSHSDLPKTLENQAKSIKLREELGDIKGIIKCYDNIIYLNQLKGNSEEVIRNSLKIIELYEQMKDEQGESFAYSNIGLAYQKEGNIPKSLYYYALSLKINEKLNNPRGIALAYNNIGFVYDEQNDKIKALNYYEKSLKLFEKAGDKKSTATLLGNIGLLYFSVLKNAPKALDYLNRGLKLNEEIKEKNGIAYSLNNIGTIYKSMNENDTALTFYFRSLKISQALGDNTGITNVFANIGDVYLRKKQLPLAYSFSDSALTLAKKMNYPSAIRKAEYSLVAIDSALENYEGAFGHYKQFIIYRDSINNEGNRKASIRSQLNYEFEKKEAVIKEQQEKERVIAEEKNRFQQIVIFSVITGLLLVIIFAIFISRSLRVAKQQKLIIEEKQKEILDSIHYAKRIQTSLLPTEKYIEKGLKRF